MANVIIEQLTLQELKKRGINDWPIWTKEVSRFDWFYDSEEQCFFLEGEVEIEATEGKFQIKAGDFVTFRKGLSCVWNVKKPVRKHYYFK
jgi:uncharacterized protein